VPKARGRGDRKELVEEGGNSLTDKSPQEFTHKEFEPSFVHRSLDLPVALMKSTYEDKGFEMSTYDWILKNAYFQVSSGRGL
jgi:hypothetical protein